MTAIPWARILAGLGLVVALVGLSVFGVAKLHSDLEDAGAAKFKAGQALADSAAQARNRQLEADLSAAHEEINDARVHEQQKVAAVGAAMRADADRVRSQLADALGGRGAAEDSLAACQQRAAAAGDLLDEGLRVQIDLAEAAESLAADARAVHAFDGKVKAATRPVLP
jgi:hypothetical protein